MSARILTGGQISGSIWLTRIVRGRKTIAVSSCIAIRLMGLDKVVSAHESVATWKLLASKTGDAVQETRKQHEHRQDGDQRNIWWSHDEDIRMLLLFDIS